MLDKQKTKPSFIGLAGNIGVGKTTFTKLLSEKLNWEPFFESVSDNPYSVSYTHLTLPTKLTV